MASVLPSPKGILKNPALRPAQIEEQDEEQRRLFGDASATRKRVYNKVLGAVQTLEPTVNQRHTLALTDVHYSDRKPFTRDDEKQAILGGGSLGRRIKGTWNLIDNASGKTVDTKTTTVATVPHMTDRGTFINNGTEYALVNQMRLRPGVYTRVKDNGEIEAHANLIPGKGMSHRYFLDPEKGQFHIRVGQAKIPLMPLLKTLGATDKQLQESWGPDLFHANGLQNDSAAIGKLYTRLVSTNKRDPNISKEEAIARAIKSMRMDKGVNQRTLGKDYDRINVESILATTRKLLAVSRGEQEVDDRDHLAYQTVLGPEDLLSERIAKDYGGAQRNLLYKSSFRGNLGYIQPGALNRQLRSVLLHSGLGQSLEEINPADIFDKQSRISRLGEGGIPSSEAVPDEARSVQPSHLGFIDPVRTPESFKVGVDVHLANAVKKGRDGRIYAPFIDARTGKKVYRSPQDIADLAIAFPGEMKRESTRVGAMRGGKLAFVRKRDVDLVMPDFEKAFSPLGNMIPIKSAMKAQRMAMASRMLTQALPLQNPEAPLVQSGVHGSPELSFEKAYSKHMGAIYTNKPARVVRSGKKDIVLEYRDGTQEKKQLYHNFPYNRKTYIHNTSVVKAGDTLKAGQLIARSNFTDGDGTAALGLNARVAYIPFRGMNFEDAIVISESMAKRLSSEHMYQESIDWSNDYKQGKKSYVGIFPGKYNRETLLKVDDDGVVLEGQVVQKDDPLILAARQQSRAKNKVHKKRQAGHVDASVTWHHSNPGIVTDVLKTKAGTTVLVKSLSPMQVGDKMSGRYGDKGVIADIIPDDQMPQNNEGQPFEALLNPLGVITRTNPSQMVEAALGKIAAKTGKPYKVRDFDEIHDLVTYTMNELDKHGLKDLEDIIDPETGRKIPQVFTGNRFFMKLHHTAEGKGQGRGTGGYTAVETPAKGGEHGSKRISLLDTNALLAHGATGTLRDAGSVRGQRNEEYWLQFMQGLTPAKPKVPLVYRKFVADLKASGINVVEHGSKLNIMAMTNKDVDELAGNRNLENAETVKFEKELEPIKGGLFDPKLTGGHHGNRWAAIKLQEPMPNPVMEEPIRRILGMTVLDFEAVLAGRKEHNGCTGPACIARSLENINLNKEIAVARMQIKSGKKTYRDKAVRKLGYLKSAKKLGINPGDWILKRVPVLPPNFRPVSVMSGSKLPLVADPNYLYKELLEANKNLKDMKKEVDDVGAERLAVYHAFKGVTGLGDPIHPKNQERQVKGILKAVFGSSPKMGTVQRRLIASTVDLVGRAVITPDSKLDMDQVGIPETRAWDIYKSFIIRRLRRRGLPLVRAAQEVKNKSDIARDEMLKEMSERPIVINRAPVLHKFGIMSFWPRLVKDDTLHVSPLIVTGFNADFDGDAMQYHVPVSEAARKEAIERLMPSKNLISPADFKSVMHKPSREYASGLYAASAGKTRKRLRTFRNVSDLRAAYKAGEIDIDDPVEVLS